MNSIINIGYIELIFSSFLIVLIGIISFILKLKQEKVLLIATIRTVAQLFLIGFILKEVFKLQNIWLLLAVVSFMLVMAGHTAVKRSPKKFKGLYQRTFFTMALCGLLTTFYVTKVVVDVTPWYNPQYMIPILGMVLGNSLNGISLCIDAMMDRLELKKNEIEMELSLGATKWEAASRHIRESIRKGMIPIINAMTVVGIVQLPGMMTGQILSGTDPVIAIKYQIVIMFMIAAAVAIGSIMMTLLIYQKVFNEKHQLVLEVLN